VIGVELELEGVPVTPDASIGWAEWPEHGEDVDHLLHNADLALYAAKDASMGVVRYSAELQPADVSRLGLVAELRQAVARSNFELHYQPKIDIESGQLVGFEALVRWAHPERGLLPPSEFVSVLETTSLIGPLTRWVFDSAVAQLASWGEAAANLSVAVNVSVRNLRDPTMTAWFVQRLAFHGIHPSRVIIEITETAIATDPRRVMEHISQLESAGIRISLDDFGQGYTSLSQLSTLRVNELKIDREFISSMHDSLKDSAIVASVIELGHRLGLNVVAEGVESTEALDVLRSLGCDVAQGYLYSKPLTATAARAYFEGRLPFDNLVSSSS
jgi:EAL domain-containing protein (putative c-di-GMP-specific phosphodiesterase class I)